MTPVIERLVRDCFVASLLAIHGLLGVIASKAKQFPWCAGIKCQVSYHQIAEVIVYQNLASQTDRLSERRVTSDMDVPLALYICSLYAMA